MIRLRITPDGTVRGLWTDEAEFAALGHSHVRRASHVEFDESTQRWSVREAIPSIRWRRCVQLLTGRPLGRILHQATSRRDALLWEQRHFEPGGAGWPDASAGPHGPNRK